MRNFAATARKNWETFSEAELQQPEDSDMVDARQITFMFYPTVVVYPVAAAVSSATYH